MNTENKACSGEPNAELPLTAAPPQRQGSFSRRICSKNNIAGLWVENLTQLEITSFRNYWKRNLIK